MSPIVDHLAFKGFRLFPLHGIDGKLHCTCEDGSTCGRPGKHPRFSGWQDTASCVPFVVQSVFSKWHTTNIGVATGQGLVVIDCDTADAEAAFLAEFDIPLTYCVSTRQGTHFYFRHGPDLKFRTVTAWRPGVDIRAEGGLVVAAGSTHVSGYVYAECPASAERPSDLPESLASALPALYDRPEGYGVIQRQRSTAEMPGADAVMRSLYLDPARSLSHGERNADLYKLACRLYESIWMGLFFESRLEQLANAAQSSGLTSTEVRRTLDSAKRRVERDNT